MACSESLGLQSWPFLHPENSPTHTSPEAGLWAALGLSPPAAWTSQTEDWEEEKVAAPTPGASSLSDPFLFAAAALGPWAGSVHSLLLGAGGACGSGGVGAQLLYRTVWGGWSVKSFNWRVDKILVICDRKKC